MSHAFALELLAPARNLESGIAAIEHGADAVYIGGPSFGARASAGNSMSDIAALAAHAHRYSASVLLALNTILRDDELEEARRVVVQAYEAGVDALIVQDMGLLELDLPPIQLHASTQCDIRTPAKARFLQDVGFSQIVLARELDLEQIRAIAEVTERERCALEFFIHGALCVSYSGQCTISHAFTGRSANRGECAQMCRLPWSLKDADGTPVAERRHLLSLKDNDQTANLEALVDAGIRSFKIEGRLKDLAYVKNVTAHYRQALDGILEVRPELARSSAGRSTFSFTPRPDKTFNRGSTDYFVNGRHGDIESFESPKFVGAPVGRVLGVSGRFVTVAAAEPLANGDGLAWFNAAGELLGARVNRVDGDRIQLVDLPQGLVSGATLYRNVDHAFENQLAGKSAERRVPVRLCLADAADGLALTMSDETGISATATLACDKAEARDPVRAQATLRDSLAKLGGTMFVAAADDVALDTAQPWFVPVGQLNALRRAAVEALTDARAAAWQRPPRALPVDPPARYPDTSLNYLGNVFNARAREFYRKHGVGLIADAFEANHEDGLVSLMITKHCLRYSFNLCPKQVKGVRPEPMTLWQERADGERMVREPLTLRFDCKKCEMHVVGRRVGGKAARPQLAD
ncbi:U32 family peptidase [Aromatoleum toluolicum]|uniref:Collagenase-like protease n=1 Tax=Aromatoleum toluolicum TaxID=90060 RepID=A0ABX1NN33_9RHOO|nr:U32 family peptidase [Aromatoleum toluolicum]NMG00446.1 U32 family peptidase [Aromatoleum toluolicum]